MLTQGSKYKASHFILWFYKPFEQSSLIALIQIITSTKVFLNNQPASTSTRAFKQKAANENPLILLFTFSVRPI